MPTASRPGGCKKKHRAYRIATWGESSGINPIFEQSQAGPLLKGPEGNDREPRGLKQLAAGLPPYPPSAGTNTPHVPSLALIKTESTKHGPLAPCTAAPRPADRRQRSHPSARSTATPAPNPTRKDGAIHKAGEGFPPRPARQAITSFNQNRNAHGSSVPRTASRSEDTCHPPGRAAEKGGEARTGRNLAARRSFVARACLPRLALATFARNRVPDQQTRRPRRLRAHRGSHRLEHPHPTTDGRVRARSPAD